MSDQIVPILMPKWGLSMKEGSLSAWHVEQGKEIAQGDEIMDVETDKISNAVEAADGGLLRRCVAEEGEVYPVGALLGVLAPASVSDAEVDAYVEAFEMPEIEDEEEVAPSYEFADLPLGRIRYTQRAGEGVPILLIHGFGGDLDNWLFNIDALGESAGVTALDLPGHGQSAKSADNASADKLVEAVVALMDHLDHAKAHLVGHSMGGFIAGLVADKHSDRVASLTLISSAGLGQEINSDYLDGFVGSASRRELKPHLKNLFADEGLVSRAMVEDLLKYKRLDGVEAFLNTLKSNLFPGGQQAMMISEALGSFQGKTQIVWGEQDAVIPQSHAGAVSGASVTVIPGAGHMVQMEASTKVNDLIKQLI